jgi:hypothetical protein
MVVENKKHVVDEAPVSDDQTMVAATSGGVKKASITALVEGALLLDIVVVLCLVRTFIPIPGFQGLIRLLCPAPYVLLGMRNGVRAAAMATVGGYIVLSALVGPVFGTQILVYGAIGTVYAAAARLRLPYLVALSFGALIYGGYLAFVTVGVPLILGVINLHISATVLIGKIKDQLTSLAHAIGGFHLGSFSLHSVSWLRNFYHWTLDHWLAALIVLVVFYGVINSWAFLFVTREIMARVDRDIRMDARGRRIDFYPPIGL